MCNTARGPIISSNSSWIEMKPTHQAWKQGADSSLYAKLTMPRQIWYQTHYSTLLFQDLFAEKNTFSTISLLLRPFLPKRWQNTTNLTPSYFVAGIRIAAVKTPKTGHLPLCNTQPSHCTNSSLFSARDQLCSHKTSFCCLNPVETVDISSWKRCVFSTCPSVTVSISALQPALLTW